MKSASETSTVGDTASVSKASTGTTVKQTTTTNAKSARKADQITGEDSSDSSDSDSDDEVTVKPLASIKPTCGTTTARSTAEAAHKHSDSSSSGSDDEESGGDTKPEILSPTPVMDKPQAPSNASKKVCTRLMSSCAVYTITVKLFCNVESIC